MSLPIIKAILAGGADLFDLVSDWIYYFSTVNILDSTLSAITLIAAIAATAMTVIFSLVTVMHPAGDTSTEQFKKGMIISWLAALMKKFKPEELKDIGPMVLQITLYFEDVPMLIVLAFATQGQGGIQSWFGLAKYILAILGVVRKLYVLFRAMRRGQIEVDPNAFKGLLCGGVVVAAIVLIPLILFFTKA